jgi:outer membrane autotransporter protein
MKTRKLTLSALSASALNVLAQNLVVTSNTTVSDTHYENKATGTAALTNSGTWTFTGSNVTLTGAAASGNGQDGARFTGGGTLNLFSGTVDANRYGIYLSNTSAANVNATTITATGSGARGIDTSSQSTATVTDSMIEVHGHSTIGINSNGSTLILTGGTITATGTSARGLYSGMQGANATIIDTKIETQGDRTTGIFLSRDGNTLTMTGGTVTVTGSAAWGIYAALNSTATLNNTTIEAHGNNAAGALAYVTSTLNLTGGAITVSGSDTCGLIVESQAIGTLTGLTITAQGDNAIGLNAVNTSTLTATGGAIVTTGEAVTGVRATQASTVRLSGLTVETTGYRARGLKVLAGGTDAATASTGSYDRVQILTHGDEASGVLLGDGIITGNTVAYHRAEFTDSVIATTGNGATGIVMSQPTGYTANSQLILDHTTVSAEQGRALVIGDDGETPVNFGSTTPDFAATDATFELILHNGAELNPADGSHAIFMDSKITGTLDNDPTMITGTQGRMVLTAQVTDAAINGSVAIQTSATATLNLTHSTLSGDTLADGSSSLTLSGSDGTVITGNLTASDSAVINVTLSGSNNTLFGDIVQNDHAAITVILDHGATGSGGFDGGTLSVGGDSAWDFTKDSATDRIDNHGTIHLGTTGNYIALRSDTISGDGTWYFPIDSDTGAKSIVSGSTAADSHPRGIISATGDGLRDPNTVANTLVTGENKENWIWDNFSWGLDEYTQDGHDAAGNPHFTRHGVSPIGTTLGSAIAIQQSMWFAQQDNLLKRMGELRYGPRASRPPADKDVRAPYNNLIENIWLRSYGQQLNVGSQVAGQAYEQLIYGIDLGTDHKFTLNADHDLYLGIYAGYGRSDLDYRTPGADGDLNSYYGGLYATWLHSSGFYLDATIKAASVDNNLKAPYDNTQLTADYNNVNIGGSLELGKKFTFTDDWFIEPQFQVNYLHILAEDYTAGPMNITTSDLDALQLRIGSVFGRTINLTNGGALQPYIKISGVETISSGGTLHNGYQHTRANTDGARAEFGAGLIWQLDTNNQLHLDYEASFGDKYDKPWGLTAGYRHQF